MTIKAKSVWVLLAHNWEYNDETYDQYGFSTPSRVYLTKEKAAAALKEKNREIIMRELKSPPNRWEALEYYSWEGVTGFFNDECVRLLEERTKKAGLNPKNLSLRAVSPHLTEDDIEVLVNGFHGFYEIQEVQVTG